MNQQVLLVECDDRPGLVHGITGLLFGRGGNIVENSEYVDREERRFFMRTEFTGAVGDAGALEDELRALLPDGASARLAPAGPRRLAILCSREHHCLADLLVRHEFHELNATIAAVLSNHDHLRRLTERFGVPFEHWPHEGRTREAHEAELLAALARIKPDYVVLAKYMRVLGAAFVGQYAHRIINIHHSFLPAFAGARPYHQAFTRGVKVIGATAHFVTAELDQGPIIVQQVIPVDHTRSPNDLAQAGRDIEQTVLARALKLVLEDRVFLCGTRTVIFD